MLDQLFKNNPLGVLMLCGSIIGSAYLVNYRIDKMEQQNLVVATKLDAFTGRFSQFEIAVNSDMDDLQSGLRNQISDMKLHFTTEVANVNLKIALLQQEHTKDAKH
ncbi:TPA: hypothetical protein ACOJPC_003125 [Vibrio fluvialis]|uniref:hypothetical protein n=1 Tax=Vibrio fluvialis TaxID=676 RepID=UPI001F310479|nr:hypothetical protein [Vibrio fluvialis]MCE7580929.1 hypothetical protein [Vibrio fluvialis]WDY54276.1 hypothetical protein PUN47_20720 [Vibrio fluvialis]